MQGVVSRVGTALYNRWLRITDGSGAGPVAPFHLFSCFREAQAERIRQEKHKDARFSTLHAYTLLAL